jgi:molybdopterin-guanine dinucleotide biosynthesis protein A
VSEAGIVLCGGRSRRMGRDKASLPFLGETLLARVVRAVRGAVGEVVLVAREGQDLGEAREPVARDPAEGLGPLAGIAAGLRAVRAERAFVTGCDAPFLTPAVVRRLLDLSRGFDAAVPLAGGFYMTTCAVYARACAEVAERLVARRRMRPLFLVEAVRTRIVAPEELSDVDPELLCFLTCNTPEEYEAALRRAGARVRVELFGIARARAGAAAAEVEAGTLAEALRALAARFPGLEPDVLAGGTLTEHYVVSLNGERFVRDPGTPLHPGDVLLLLGAQAGG